MIKASNLISAILIVSLSACYYDKEDELYGGGSCEIVTVSFSKDIMPLIQSGCATTGCHVQGGSGNGIFENYQGVKDKVDNGSFKDRVITLRDMPPSSPLSNCQIAYIEAWINEGAPNN